MSAYSFECLHTYEEFQAIRDSWEEFTQCFFPGNYGRSHAWLSAYWTTYHHKQSALIYIQKSQSGGKIVAAAPLFIRKENFGGFPILSLQSLGVGIGTDDFLISPESRDFVDSVFIDLVKNQRWHVANFRRLRFNSICEDVKKTCTAQGCQLELASSKDYYIEFPANYSAYLQSRTRKFRRNLNQAANRIEKEGSLTTEILDPFKESGRVREYGVAVAETSWQFQEGKSHFNDTGSGTLYENLARTGYSTNGEEFTVMMVNGRPVAYLLGCIRERIYYAVDTAYHAEYRHVSIGRILMNGVIERLIGQDLADYFDFEGSGEYKDDYATTARDVNVLTIYNHSLYPWFIRLIRKSALYSKLKVICNRQKNEAPANA